MVFMAKNFGLEYQAEKVTNILMLLDMLEGHGMRLTNEIEVIEHIQDNLFKRIEYRDKLKEEAKK